MAKQYFGKFRKSMEDALKKEFGDKALKVSGNQDAKIVLIGQAPSQSGVKKQKPFDDQSGEKLRNIWFGISRETFYNPDNFYITALGMYYPGKNPKGGDLKPSLPWAEKWLRKEIDFLNPKLFILIGRMSAHFFFPKRDFKELIFSDQILNGRKTIVLPHPSPLNIRWFSANPEFYIKRLPQVKRSIQEILG